MTQSPIANDIRFDRQGAGFQQLSRRNFMKFSGGCAALSSTSLLSQLLSLQMTGAVMADEGGGGDYKALVCLFLLGGIDSSNVLVPYETSEHAAYSTIRTNLALSRGSLANSTIQISANNNRRLAVHPNMGELRTLFNDGKAAFVANVGSLVQPTTRSNYNSVKLPLGLFSHSDLVQHWMTCVPQSRSVITGWGGRAADLLTANHNNNNNISMNISLDGLNMFQSGNTVVPYVIQSNGATELGGHGGTWARDRIYTAANNYVFPSSVDSQLGSVYSNLLQLSYAKTKKISMDAAVEFNSATSADPATTFPDTNLGRQLRMVAKTIRARTALSQTRQIFFVTMGGWDHHDEVINAQARMLPQVSQAVKAFYDETVAMGIADKVTLFTASDFGRTLNSNGNGSDHGWGGNQFVVGGAVNGRTVYGDYPATLAANNSLDLGRGRLIPTTSVDTYHAELALWFGVSNNQSLVDILPNIRTFYSSGASQKPIGFMA